MNSNEINMCTYEKIISPIKTKFFRDGIEGVTIFSTEKLDLVLALSDFFKVAKKKKKQILVLSKLRN